MPLNVIGGHSSCIKDHTYATLKRGMAAWHRELQRAKQLARYPKWAGIAVQDCTIVRKIKKTTTHWRFHQITTGAELANEGNAQHHCVSSYAPRCAAGSCSIWSLTANGQRALTIEVEGRVVRQAAGYANRRPKAEEIAVMREWMRECAFISGIVFCA